MTWKFWEKEQQGSAPAGSDPPKLAGPKRVHETVGRFLVVRAKAEPNWVWALKQVERRRSETKSSFDVRVYDEKLTAAKNVFVKDFCTLDEHPDLILYEGWFDKKSMQVELIGKKEPPRAA